MLPDLKITQLRHFVWVAELKGFHAAAEKAHRSQPAISLSIKDLENKVGEALFEKRQSRSAKAELTPFGQYLLPQAKELIAHHDRLSHDLVLMAEHKTGHLRLASIPSIASRMMPEILEKLVSDAPELHISFFDDNANAVLNMVENQEVDFGIASLWYAEEHDDKTFIPIARDPVGVVCREDHPLASLDQINWEALREYRLIRNGTSRLLEGSAAELLLGESQFYISNMISLLAMLRAGMGVTTLPWFAFPTEDPQLKFIPFDNLRVAREIGIIHLNSRSLSPAAEAAVKLISAYSVDHYSAYQQVL